MRIRVLRMLYLQPTNAPSPLRLFLGDPASEQGSGLGLSPPHHDGVAELFDAKGFGEDSPMVSCMRRECQKPLQFAAATL